MSGVEPCRISTRGLFPLRNQQQKSTDDENGYQSLAAYGGLGRRSADPRQRIRYHNSRRSEATAIAWHQHCSCWRTFDAPAECATSHSRSAVVIASMREPKLDAHFTFKSALRSTLRCSTPSMLRQCESDLLRQTFASPCLEASSNPHEFCRQRRGCVQLRAVVLENDY